MLIYIKKIELQYSYLQTLITSILIYNNMTLYCDSTRTECIKYIRAKLPKKTIMKYIRDDNICYIDKLMVDIISNLSVENINKIFDTINVNNLAHCQFLMNSKNIITWLSMLTNSQIKFDAVIIIKATYYYDYGGDNTMLDVFNIIFDYLHENTVFDSYDFIYYGHVSVHLLEIVTQIIPIDHTRIIKKMLRHHTTQYDVISYLLDNVHYMINIDIDDIMDAGSFKLINKFIENGTHIEIINDNDTDKFAILNLFKYIDIKYIHLIRQINLSRHIYSRLIMYAPVEKINLLLSNGCIINFNNRHCDDKIASESSQRMDLIAAHHIDPLFILQYLPSNDQ